MKKIWIGLIVVVFMIILSLVVVEYFTGIPIGKDCGYWNFFTASEKICDCVGIKTGFCPVGAVCDGGSFGCIGICQNCLCRRLNDTTQNMETVPCD